MFVDPFTPKSDQFSLLRWKLIEQLFLTMSLKHFLLEWLGEFKIERVTQSPTG